MKIWKTMNSTEKEACRRSSLLEASREQAEKRDKKAAEQTVDAETTVGRPEKDVEVTQQLSNQAKKNMKQRVRRRRQKMQLKATTVDSVEGEE